MSRCGPPSLTPRCRAAAIRGCMSHGCPPVVTCSRLKPTWVPSALVLRVAPGPSVVLQLLSPRSPIHTRHIAAHKGRGALTSLRLSRFDPPFRRVPA